MAYAMPIHRARLFRSGFEDLIELARRHPDENADVLASLEEIDAKHISPILGERVDEDHPPLTGDQE